MSVSRTMDCTKWFVCLCIFLEFCSRSYAQPKEKSYITEAGQIFGTIFHKYNPQVLPWAPYPKPLQLTVHVTPVYVAGVDPVTQTMTSTIDLQVEWRDQALSWFTEVVNVLTISKDKVWHPLIAVKNAVGKVSEIDNADLVLQRRGWVVMIKRLQLTTLCPTPPNATEYNCSIIIGTPLYDSDMIIFSTNSTFNTDKVVVSNTIELQGSLGSFLDVPAFGDNKTAINAEYIATMTLSKTNCCETKSGVASLRSLIVVTAMALVIALFAQQ